MCVALHFLFLVISEYMCNSYFFPISFRSLYFFLNKFPPPSPAAPDPSALYLPQLNHRTAVELVQFQTQRHAASWIASPRGTLGQLAINPQARRRARLWSRDLLREEGLPVLLTKSKRACHPPSNQQHVRQFLTRVHSAQHLISLWLRVRVTRHVPVAAVQSPPTLRRAVNQN